MNFAGLEIDLGAAAPDHRHSVQTVLALKILDVLHDLECQFVLVTSPLDVAAFQSLHIFLAENCFPGADLFQLGTNQV